MATLATPLTYLDLRNQPLRTRRFAGPGFPRSTKFSSWPPGAGHQEATELAVEVAPQASGAETRVEQAVYGGGRVHGPLTEQQVTDITAAGHAALLVTEPGYTPGDPDDGWGDFWEAV